METLLYPHQASNRSYLSCCNMNPTFVSRAFGRFYRSSAVQSHAIATRLSRRSIGSLALAQFSRCSSSTSFTTASPLLTTTRRGKGSAAAAAVAVLDVTAAFDHSIHQPFPSIVIGPKRSIEPQGSFAEAQARVRQC